MWVLKACRICLATGVTLQSMNQNNLGLNYKVLCGIKAENTDGLPWNLCVECSAYLRKYSLFRKKCRRAHFLLKEILDKKLEITEADVKAVDRVKTKLATTIGLSGPGSHHFISLVENEEDPSEDEDMVYEDDHDCGDEPETSLGDMPVIKLFNNANVDEELPVIEKPADAVVYDDTSIPVGNYKTVAKLKNSSHHVEHVISGTMLTAVQQTVVKDSIKSCTTGDMIDLTEEEVPRGLLNVEDKLLPPPGSRLNDYIKVTALTREQEEERYRKMAEKPKFVNAKFKCTLCVRVFRTDNILQEHIRLRHAEAVGHMMCVYCKRRYKSSNHLLHHLTEDHAMHYECMKCTYTTYLRLAASRHYKRHLKLPNMGAKARMQAMRRKLRPRHEPSDRPHQKRPSDFPVQKAMREEDHEERLNQRRGQSNYMNAPLRCEPCAKGFYTEKGFRNHQLRHDPVSGEFQCYRCEARYSNKDELKRHVTSTHIYKFECRMCPRTMYSRCTANDHYNSHRSEFKCMHCDAVHFSKWMHQNHVRRVHSTKYLCSLCAKSFLDYVGLKRHANMTHGGKTISEECKVKCVACDVWFLSDDVYRKHILNSPQHGEEAKLIPNACSFCGQLLETAEALLEHRRTKHPSPNSQRLRKRKTPAQCTQCGVKFPCRNDLYNHFRTAHPDEQYPHRKEMLSVCEECGKGCQNRYMLAVHMRMHTGERPFPCAACSRAFSTRQALRTHALLHDAATPHMCHYCGRAFKMKPRLVRHMRIHTGEKPFKCFECDMRFADGVGRKSHMRSAHWTPQYGAPRKAGRGRGRPKKTRAVPNPTEHIQEEN